MRRCTSAARETHVLLAGMFILATAFLRAQAGGQSGVNALPSAWVPPAPSQRALAQTIAVRAGRLFDPRSGTLRVNQVILIRGERIIGVGAELEIPAGTQTIDLSRATVLPGLIDTHLHTMDGNPITGPGGAGVGPAGPGPLGLNQPLQYRELAALINAKTKAKADFTLWGHAYKIVCDNGDFGVLSWGPDGKEGSDDDIGVGAAAPKNGGK